MLAYCLSIYLLPTYFDRAFMETWDFAGKVAIITVAACAPVHAVQSIKRRLNPPAHIKLRA